jgi:glycosyltransferase involved in cell wall biosynthesis
VRESPVGHLRRRLTVHLPEQMALEQMSVEFDTKAETSSPYGVKPTNRERMIAAETATEHIRPRVLIIFGGVALYGMERGVIETFDLLRPEVEPHFLISRTPRRMGLPVFDEIESRKFSYAFLSDYKGWERLGKPKSFSQLYKMLVGFFRGNLDAFREVRDREILYLPGLFSAIYAFVAMLYCRVKGRRVFYHFHNLSYRPSIVLRFLAFPVTDFVHNTRLGYEATLSANPYLGKKRNYIIPCPINVNAPALEHAFPSLELNGKRHILYLGQVAHYKGVDLLLDAFDKLSLSHSDLVLDIVGGCEDSHLLQRMETGTEKNGCQIKWWGYQEDVGKFLTNACMYVQPTPPSRCKESFGIALVEAMATGVPTVCFRSGALQEITQHEETGLVCEEESSECLASQVSRLLDDEPLRKSCGKGAKERYESLYSSIRVKRKWLQALDGFVDKRND